MVYTDAQYNPATKRAGLARAVIVDTEDGTSLFAGALTPPDILAWLDPRAQQINQLELLAALCAMLNFPELFQRREIRPILDAQHTCLERLYPRIHALV